MPIRKVNPTSPGRRFQALQTKLGEQQTEIRAALGQVQ